jgi:hypothetical protein
VQTILSMILAYLVFVTRTWGVTRLAVVIDVVLALLYDFTPLRLRYGGVETAALVLTFILWAVNLLVDRQRSVA